MCTGVEEKRNIFNLYKREFYMDKVKVVSRFISRGSVISLFLKVPA